MVNRTRTKPVEFVGTALEDMRSMPEAARQDAGYQLHLVQQGETPPGAKPLHTVGAGAMGLRVWCADGTWRVIYVAKFASAVYVLHVFQKKTQATPKSEINKATDRYRQIAAIAASQRE